MLSTIKSPNTVAVPASTERQSDPPSSDRERSVPKKSCSKGIFRGKRAGHACGLRHENLAKPWLRARPQEIWKPSRVRSDLPHTRMPAGDARNMRSSYSRAWPRLPFPLPHAKSGPPFTGSQPTPPRFCCASLGPLRCGCAPRSSLPGHYGIRLRPPRRTTVRRLGSFLGRRLRRRLFLCPINTLPEARCRNERTFPRSWS